MKFITATSLTLVVACSGADGAPGEDGSDGEPGESPELTTRAARAADCPNGGVEFAVEDDVYTVCNGTDGEDGEPGAPGPAGMDGADGEPGPAGPAGAPGPAGSDGADGEDGAPGVDGMDGEPGPAGPSGSDGENGAGASVGTVEASIYCGGGLEGASPVLLWQYWAAVFTDGTVWASASVSDNLSQASGSRIYAPDQVGADTAAVTFTFDVQDSINSGWWLLEVARDPIGVHIEYHDNDLFPGGLSEWFYDAAGGGCVVNEY